MRSTLLFTLLSACTQVQGGSAEVSWTIRTHLGQPRVCADADVRLTAAQLHSAQIDCVVPPCTITHDSTLWPCDRYRGSIPFVLAPGRWQFTLHVFCPDGEDTKLRVPDPVVRDVVLGQVVNLNAFLVSVEEGCHLSSK